VGGVSSGSFTPVNVAPKLLTQMRVLGLAGCDGGKVGRAKS
jgi:hypothetical protein